MMTTDQDPPHLGTLLGRLPQESPPGHLWSRIVESRLGAETRRRRRLGAACAALGVVLIATVGLLVPRSSPPVSDLAMLQVRTQLLEERLMAYELSSSRMGPVAYASLGAIRADLMAIDEAMTRAYAEDRPERELAHLWQRRLERLEDLVAAIEAHAAGAEAI